MAQVSLDGISKQYPNGVQALQPTSLQAADGEFLVLVGPSGCGKTTLLRILAGLEVPSTGTVRINGSDVTHVPAYRRDVAMVFQRPTLYPHLNVRSNLAFGLDARRFLPWLRRNLDRDKRVADAAGILGLGDVLDRRPAELSGGQQQRVALGRAIVRRPAVFLLDEPLSNLDFRLRVEMRRELHLLHKKLQATMFYVTHDQEEALTLGDRVAVLREGSIQQIDHGEVLYERPANRFVAGFLGWPAMNLFDGEIVSRQGQLWLVKGADEFHLGSVRQVDWLPFAGRRVTVGLRPEHLTLAHTENADATLSMKVQLAETLGADCVLTLGHGHWTASLRVERSLAPAEQATVAVSFVLARAHLFDQESGCALSHGLPTG
jgi:multiple sugar transport system ATP-binding protein